jgi:hypothetical protein
MGAPHRYACRNANHYGADHIPGSEVQSFGVTPEYTVTKDGYSQSTINSSNWKQGQ